MELRKEERTNGSKVFIGLLVSGGAVTIGCVFSGAGLLVGGGAVTGGGVALGVKKVRIS
jgi:hypothetical protein